MPADRIHVYELLDALPRGGLGRVHSGRVAEPGGPLDPGAQVVLRVVQLSDVIDERTIARLGAAHAAARKISSPAVLSCIDHGVTMGSGMRLWSVSPWVAGRTLAEVLRTADVVPDPLTESILGQAAAGLVAAHAAGVVGVGLSPDSILLREDGTAVLADVAFGAAVGAGWPGTGAAPASMMCASPEILGGATPDARSDLFALGCILFRCMTGRWHRPEDARALNLHAREMDAARPNDDRPKCSLFLSEIAHALLRTDRADRIKSATDLVTILTERRKSAWWRTLHIDQDTHDDEPASRRPIAHEPPPPPIPQPAPAPDDDYYRQRRSATDASARHLARCVGRDAELSVLSECASRLADQGGRVVLVEGAAGSGKTRLLDAFCEKLGQLPAHKAPHVLRGEHRSAGVGRPFGAFTEALTRWLHDDRIADPHDVAPLLGESAGIAPAFAAVLSSDALDASAQPLARESVPPAFLRCLRTICARAPVVVVIENLQWADPEVLDLFSYIARIGTDLPLLVIGSYRPPQADGDLAEMAALLRAQPRVREIRLAPLDAGRLAALAREVLEPPAAAAEIARCVFEASGGDAGALVESVLALEAEHALEFRADGRLSATPALATAKLPAGLADAVRRRLGSLGAREVAYLGAASVQGVAFDAEVTRIASGLDVRAAARVLEDLTTRRFVIGDGVARRFATQPLFDAVVAGLQDAALSDRHEATATAFLESRNPDQLPPSRIHGILSYRVAWHYLLSGRAARGLLYVNAAIQHLRGTFRHGDGERLTALACRVLASDSGRGADTIDMLLERSRFLDAQGRAAEQRAALEDALTRARERRDLMRESRILLEFAKADATLGDAGRADDDAKQALACAHRAGETDIELKVHMRLASAAFRESRLQDARAHYAEALSIAARRSDVVTESEIHHGLGLVAQGLGAFDQADESFRTALLGHRARGDLVREADTLACTGNLAAAGGDLVRAEGCLRRALAIHMALGDGTGETRVLGLLAMVLQEGGCLVDAREVHAACLDRARRLDARGSEVVALLNLATVDGFLGRLDDARDAYGEALRSAVGFHDARLQGYALTGLGETSRQRGDSDVARDLLSRATQQFRAAQDPSGLAAALLAAGRLEAFAGDAEVAQAHLLEAYRLSEQQNARQVTAITEALLALLAARARDAEEAERRIARSALALADIRASDATRTELLFLQSIVLRVLGRRVEANQKLLQAEVMLVESLRGLPDADRDRVLRELTPGREICAGADAARSAASPQAVAVFESTDTVAV
ncbi:MAG: AAA family ATPase [Planctomycetes bacterium]|nr:AAA family ATPase [Planctomycetota bacterium]